MRREAKVLLACQDTAMQDKADVWRVETDYTDPANRAFYLKRKLTQCPEVGSTIVWGQEHAWYTVKGEAVEAEKHDWNFNPDQPFH